MPTTLVPLFIILLLDQCVSHSWYKRDLNKMTKHIHQAGGITEVTIAQPLLLCILKKYYVVNNGNQQKQSVK